MTYMGCESMIAMVIGEVVDLDRNEWDLNGRQGTAYGVYLRAGLRDQPQRIRVTEAQFKATVVGGTVEWPCSIVALESNYGAPRLRVTLDQDFVVGDGFKSELVGAAPKH